MPSLEAGLLFNCALGMGNGLEPGVGDRLPALDRLPIGPVIDPLHGPLHCLELLLEALDHRLDALVLEHLRSGIGRMLVDGRKLAVPASLGPQLLQLALDAVLFCSQKLSCSARIQGAVKLAGCPDQIENPAFAGFSLAGL
jgi:hypothetical protein